jgi:hypothetical protein
VCVCVCVCVCLGGQYCCLTEGLALVRQMPIVIFCLLFFVCLSHAQSHVLFFISQKGSHIFAQVWPQSMIFLPKASQVAGTTVTHRHAWLMYCDGVSLAFFLGWTQSVIFLSSWIIGISHHAQSRPTFLNSNLALCFYLVRRHANRKRGKINNINKDTILFMIPPFSSTSYKFWKNLSD